MDGFFTYIYAAVFVTPALCSTACLVLTLLLVGSLRSFVDNKLWAAAIFFLLTATLLFSLLLYSYSASLPLSLGILLVAGCAIIVMDILLTHHITHRGALSRHIPNETKDELNLLSTPHMRREQLSKQVVDNYFHSKKPYLNPDFRLTDLAIAMGVNRTVMSNFINQTYGMNFKQFVNHWRIDEYNRLMSLPANQHKNPYKILLMAGFTDSRHYYRSQHHDE